MKYKSIEQALEAVNLSKEQKYRLVDILIDGIIRESKCVIPACGHGDPGLNLDIAYCARCYTEGK